QAFIRRPEELRDTIREVSAENGRDVKAPGVRPRLLTGLGGLSAHEPGLRALADLPICVPFHSIIPQVSFCGIELNTDGVVRYNSSHLEGAESEAITRGIHTSHDSWQVSREVKRALCEHLRSVDSAGPCRPAP